MQVVRLGSQLPPDLLQLAEQAEAESVRNMGLLRAEHASGAQRYDGEGEALFAAYVEGALAGIGGVSRETWPGIDAMRMRRFYVSPRFRRAGVGRALAGAAMQQGVQAAPMLTLNARASAAAGPFWEALGFKRDERNGWTHIYRPHDLGS